MVRSLLCLLGAGALGLACGSSHSNVKVLAQDPGTPSWIAVDQNNVYWGDPDLSTVSSAPKTGGTPAVLARVSDGVAGVAADSTYVYFGTTVGIEKLPTAGGNAISIAAIDTSPSDLRVVGSTVVWTDSGLHNVYTIPTTGGTPKAIATGNAPLGASVDAANVYWADYQAGTINWVALTGSASKKLTSMAMPATGGGPCYVANDRLNVYWTDDANGVVNAISASGGPVTTLSANLGNPLGIATDGTNVYFVDNDVGTINRVPVGGGKTDVIADGQNGPVAISLDDTHVFWTNGGDGTIVSAPK